MNLSVGMRSLALAFPPAVRTNEYWRAKYPEAMKSSSEKALAKIWSPVDTGAPPDAWDEEMARYLQDPFRGAVERRVLGPGETSLSLELRAARQALAAAAMAPGDIDLTIVSSFLPDTIGVGNAVFLARELGLGGTAWNLETACSGSLVAFETACALVRAGAHRNVLVVVSCTYSRAVDDADTLSWSTGDGATAFVVGEVRPGEGLLGFKSVHTAETCGAMYYELAGEGTERSRIRMRAGKGAGKAIRDAGVKALHECCGGAAKAAGVSLCDIHFFALTTPTAWHSAFCARELGYEPEQTFNCHPLYANTGPVLMPTNLFYGARLGRVKPGDLVMLHTVGSVSSASAAVVRWGQVGLGPEPERAVAS